VEFLECDGMGECRRCNVRAGRELHPIARSALNWLEQLSAWYFPGPRAFRQRGPGRAFSTPPLVQSRRPNTEPRPPAMVPRQGPHHVARLNFHQLRKHALELSPAGLRQADWAFPRTNRCRASYGVLLVRQPRIPSAVHLNSYLPHARQTSSKLLGRLSPSTTIPCPSATAARARKH
jgi:hypothetical protein